MRLLVREEEALADERRRGRALRCERLATSDPPLAEIARGEGCDVIALPDTRGRRP